MISPQAMRIVYIVSTLVLVVAAEKSDGLRPVHKCPSNQEAQRYFTTGTYRIAPGIEDHDNWAKFFQDYMGVPYTSEWEIETWNYMLVYQDNVVDERSNPSHFVMYHWHRFTDYTPAFGGMDEDLLFASPLNGNNLTSKNPYTEWANMGATVAMAPVWRNRWRSPSSSEGGPQFGCPAMETSLQLLAVRGQDLRNTNVHWVLFREILEDGVIYASVRWIQVTDACKSDYTTCPPFDPINGGIFGTPDDPKYATRWFVKVSDNPHIKESLDKPSLGFVDEDSLTEVKTYTDTKVWLHQYFNRTTLERRFKGFGYNGYNHTTPVERTSEVHASRLERFNVTLQDASRKRFVEATICVSVSGAMLEHAMNLYVFAHGGGLFAADYRYLCEEWQPNHVIALLGSMAGDDPMDLELMATDLNFLSIALPQQGVSNRSSPLFGRLSGQVIIAGHSMGAAAALLAGTLPNDKVVAIASMAPGFWGEKQAGLLVRLGSAQTALCEKPLFVAVGDQDCADSLSAQALYVWGNISKSCSDAAIVPRALAVMIGATHCQWTTPVEGSCNFDVPCPRHHRLGRSKQQNLGIALLSALGSKTLGATLSSMKANSEITYIDEHSNAADTQELHSYCPCGKTSDTAVRYNLVQV